MNRICLILGALFCALSVILGAFAAHGLKNLLAPSMLAVFKTGVEYQFYHGLALILFGLAGLFGIKVKWPAIFAILGTVFFSGSLYLLSTTQIAIFGPITPIGGVCFIICWVLFAIQASKFKARIN